MRFFRLFSCVAAATGLLVAQAGSAGGPAARVGDFHVCPMVTVVVPHVGGPVLAPGDTSVLICNQPAARGGDIAHCVGPPDSLTAGSASVRIHGRAAVRTGDLTAHGGVIVGGCPTVI